MRAPAARSGGAAGVSHDSPRAQLCTFQCSGLQKHQQNSTKGPQEREIRMKIVAGGGKKKERNFGRSGGGLSGEGGCPAEGCPVEGPSERGAGFGVSGFSSDFWRRKQKQNKNKMKREMSKNKKKVKKSKNKAKEKKRKRERRNRANTICSTSAN